MGDRSGGAGGGGDWITYPSLTATNYTSWSIRIQAIMEDQGVWEIMEPSGESLEQGATAAAAVKAKDKKARAHLLQCLPDDLLMPVAANKTGKEVWDSLKARFVDEECVREAWLLSLKSEFDAMRMESTRSVRRAVDGDVSPFYDLKNLAFEEAVGQLKAYEERTRRGAGAAVKSDTGQVLLTQAEWEARQKRAAREASGKSRSQESGGGSRGHGRGHGGSSGGRGGQGDMAKDGAGKRDKCHIKFFKCHKYGHYANRCPGEEKKEEAHHASVVEYESTVLLSETDLLGMLEHPSSDSLLSDGFTKDVSGEGDGRGIPLIEHPDQVSRWRADEPLELLHIDLCGPITPETAGGILVLKTKDQASDAFAKFKAEAENSLGHKVKCVRSDRGGEFLVVAFKDIYEQAEFVIDETVGVTAQQWDGGVAGGNNQDDHIHDDSGGASRGVQDTGDVENSVQHGTRALSDTVHSLATDAKNSVNHGAGLDQGDVDDNMDVDHDDGPMRFRRLNDVYQDSVEVDLASDIEVETNALLAVMEQPTCYQEAARNDNWMAVMDSYAKVKLVEMRHLLGVRDLEEHQA
ncbi:unnamed protein product [Miscanthus lutarioriparius]|uniref:CCHC-type domain-containing protein n=1 Tax=Miscanthus lutarioriparius TaxID=422564 RepID=A0A811PKW0_9POAL|nr:unnamed protein product [Miscanthus lutarioriparius]